MDSSWILTKSTIIGDLTISAGAWVKKKYGGINSLFIKQFIWAEAIFSIKVRKILSLASNTAWPWNSSPVKIISLKKKKVFLCPKHYTVQNDAPLSNINNDCSLSIWDAAMSWSAAWKCGFQLDVILAAYWGFCSHWDSGSTCGRKVVNDTGSLNYPEKGLCDGGEFPAVSKHIHRARNLEVCSATIHLRARL